MAFLFGANRRQKQPIDIAKSIKDLLKKLWHEPSNPRSTDSHVQVEEELERQMAQMKLIVQGTPEVECSPEQVQQLVQCIIQEDLLYDLARSIRLLPFEARKDAQIIFSHIFRWKPTSGRSSESAISYLVSKRPEIIVELCRGYGYPESALPCGTILRQAILQDSIAAIILYDDSRPGENAVQIMEVDVRRQESYRGLFWNFFDWINKGSFEVSADAFNTFRDILTRHKNMVAQYLSANFDEFFARYNRTLIQSESYVTKRQSIKLLGEILLDRANYNVMTAYVDRGEHLKLCMNLLKDDRKMVQYEGFHVFKVFVANPNKSVAVQRILINNRDRLLKFLPRFLEDRTDDDQFTDEKTFLVRQIELLPPEPVESRPPPVAGVGMGAALA